MDNVGGTEKLTIWQALGKVGLHEAHIGWNHLRMTVRYWNLMEYALQDLRMRGYTWLSMVMQMFILCIFPWETVSNIIIGLKLIVKRCLQYFLDHPATHSTWAVGLLSEEVIWNVVVDIKTVERIGVLCFLFFYHQHCMLDDYTVCEWKSRGKLVSVFFTMKPQFDRDLLFPLKWSFFS